jgi:flagellar L-ring protein precursor FlgH
MVLLQCGWIIIFSLIGCSTAIPPQPDKAQLLSAQNTPSKQLPPADVMPALRHPQRASEGSLWVEDGALSQMFINDKARKVGDLVTIKIVETASATNKASTKTGRTSAFDAGLDNFFNLEERYPSTSPFFNPFGGVSGSFESDFDGSGTTKRSNALTAYITARIIDILPNGILVIEGTREVRVNHENQIITLTGMVRSRDISADNVVQSTYLADARITYSGSGIINEKQRPGWLTRILGKVWPF